MNDLTALLRMSRNRVLRRMQGYGRDHVLVHEATTLSIRIKEMVEGPTETEYVFKHEYFVRLEAKESEGGD